MSVSLISRPELTIPRRLLATLALCFTAGVSLSPSAIARDGESDATLTIVEKSLAQRKAVLEEMREKLSHFVLTENQDHDFAALAQLYSEALAKASEDEVAYGNNKQMKRLAREQQRSARKMQNQTQHWLEKFHQYD